jgi:hypothetical protein
MDFQQVFGEFLDRVFGRFLATKDFWRCWIFGGAGFLALYKGTL